MAIVVMDNEEKFLQFLDPELCTLVETHEDGLRRLDLEYKFQDLHDDKQLFRIGNKVWVSNDTNLADCLYVINTPVSVDVYQENSFHCELEEVLVELNYAPLFSQNELTSSNGFKLTTLNGQQSVVINWNALNYWFGEYFNVGVVQKCLNEAHNQITITGTLTLMGLLRYIEEETGNVFVTRYEKDITTNTILRYLDFLNPINVSKDWVLNIEYDFVTEDNTDMGVFDENGDPSVDEDENADTLEEEDVVTFDADIPVSNLDPTEICFRITNKDYELLNSDGLVYMDGEDETPLIWTSEDIGFDGTVNNVVISLSSVKNVIGLTCNNKSFVIPEAENIGSTLGQGFVAPADENTPTDLGVCAIPDDSLFTFYNTSTERTIYATTINREIGTVHEEVIDFGFNLENVIFETDESETFTAIAPVITDEGEDLTRNDISTIIQRWQDMEVEKGETVPMIVERLMVPGATLAAARTSLGQLGRTNYYVRPYHPQDNIDSSDSSNNEWEFWRAIAYWRAPFTKHAGDLHVMVDNYGATEYTEIHARADLREPIPILRPKIGTLETGQQNTWVIYNEVCMKLKEHQYPEFDIQVDVANLRDGLFNQYDIHDKVYVKLPDYNELVTARVIKTSKEAHDVAKNTIELANYSNNVVKNVQSETYIIASNSNYKYPNSKDLTVRLVNADYDSEDEYSVQYPANKLITFQLYKVENGSSNLTRTTYTKRTDANGYATINMRYDPGDYELEINFGGDEEYLETGITVEISVGGTKEVYTSTNTSKLKPSDLTKQKTTAKNKKQSNTTTKKRYYSKYGVSPDGKYLMAIGRASASGELAKYGYKYYKAVFYRKCPFCGSKELYWNIFWAGNEFGSWGTNPAVGRRKSGSAEGEITCKKCDADFSIFGKDKATTPRKTLKVYKKPVKSSKTEAYSLKKGKMYYDSIKIENKQKKNVDTKTRTAAYTIPEKLRKQALSIVGNSTGLDAAKKIAAWCGNKNHLKYDNYPNFRRRPTGVLNKHKANCCDSTRFMLTLMDAAGCSEKLKLEYVHCHNSAANKGHVFAKITTRSSGKWRYVDPVLKTQNGRNPWGNHLKGYGPVVGTSNYTGPNNSPF